MADAPRGRGGFGDRGRGDRARGDRGRGRRGPRRGGPKSDEKEWQPVTKLGRLVKAGKIQSMEQIYLHSLPIKEYQIVDWFLPKLKDEVMKVSWTESTVNAGYVSLQQLLYRSNPSRSRLVPVSVLDSRPSWSLATAKVTLASASRHPKKSQPPFVPQSSSPNSPSFPSDEATGVPISVNLTPSPLRSPASVAPSPCD